MQIHTFKICLPVNRGGSSDGGIIKTSRKNKEVGRVLFKNIDCINENIGIFFWINPATKFVGSINFIKNDDVTILSRPVKVRKKVGKARVNSAEALAEKKIAEAKNKEIEPVIGIFNKLDTLNETSISQKKTKENETCR